MSGLTFVLAFEGLLFQFLQESKLFRPTIYLCLDKWVWNFLLYPQVPFVERNFLLLHFVIELVGMIVAKDFNQLVLLRMWKNVGKVCHVEELCIFILALTLRNMLHDLYSFHKIELQRSYLTNNSLFLIIFSSFLTVSLLAWWDRFSWKLVIFEWLSEGFFLEIRRLIRLIRSLRVKPVSFTLLRCRF